MSRTWAGWICVSHLRASFIRSEFIGPDLFSSYLENFHSMGGRSGNEFTYYSYSMIASTRDFVPIIIYAL